MTKRGTVYGLRVQEFRPMIKTTQADLERGRGHVKELEWAALWRFLSGGALCFMLAMFLICMLEV